MQATLGPGAVAQNIGDADKAMATAATKVEAIYQLPFLAHATMEPMNCTVHFRKDECEVWIGTQAITRVAVDGREGRWPAGGEGHRPQSSASAVVSGGDLRPTARSAPSRSPSRSMAP